MNYKKTRWALLNVFFLVFPVFGGQVVINEIMYHPYSDDSAEEYIELYNDSTNATNLHGWRFTKGIDFTFTNVTLPANGYMVVAANSNSFRSKYPGITNMVGGWTGTLRNNGEKIELEDSEGTVIDTVHYYPSGDWGMRLRGAGESKPISVTRSGSIATVLNPGNYRAGDSFVISGATEAAYNGFNYMSTVNGGSGAATTSFTYPVDSSVETPAGGTIVLRQISDYGRVGWSWSSRADGLGSSLELVNPELPNEHGQAWRASATVNGTPGWGNSVKTNNLPPMLLETHHYPPVPNASNPVTISTRVVDEQTTNLTVTLNWRVDANPANTFNVVAMFDDGLHGDGLVGDGVYGAIVPPQAHNVVVEFYVEAQDEAGNHRTWPAPALDPNDLPIQEANALYQVDNVGFSGNEPIYRIIMRGVERDELATFPSASQWTDAGMNATFISVDGVGIEVRYNSEIRDRGAGTRSRNPPNYKMSFPPDRPFLGVTGFNVNSQYTHSQAMGYALSMQSGLGTELGRLVQMRINNVNRANSGSPQFGRFMQLQSTDGNYASTHWPNDDEGNLYRCASWGHTANLYYNGTNWLTYANVGFFKQNNRSENDYSDLINLMQVLNRSVDAQYPTAIRQTINVDEWLLYQAMFQLTLSRETSLGTGYIDDFSMYRGVADPRWQVLAHDWDTILNEGDTTGGYTTDIWRSANAIPQLNTFMKHPEFAPIYFRELKRLCDTVFYPTNLSRTIEANLAGIVPVGTLDNMKTFGSNRWFNVLSQIPQTLVPRTTLGQSGGYYFTTASSAMVWGDANVIDTRTVLVDGRTSSWSAWQGRWTNTVTLQPGINQILVQSLNSNGVEFAWTNIDIWYDDGSVANVSGPVTGSNFWSAVNGPYNISSSLTVGNNATLVIESGASVYLGVGGSLTVSGSGRLIAEGTELKPIRFTRFPGTSVNWGSLDFVGATNESRIAYANFSACGGTTISGHNAQIHVNNSKVFFDHLVFANSPAIQYVSFDASSFIVQGCVFPTYAGSTGPEMLHGVNGIPSGGYGIFRDNCFGHTWGFNDTIDFTGGNRPGPILQIINNIFDGASDDHLDLDSTDAWIEGNIFTHAHRDPTRTDNPLDTSSAISGGVDVATQYSEWTIINNLFYDVDHAVLNKQGGRFTFVNNTVVHISEGNGAGITNDIAAFDFTDNGLALPNPSVGAGAYIAGNIIWDTPRLVSNYNSSNHNVIFENNILAMPWDGPGTNNLVIDPQLNLALIANVAAADWQTVKTALQPRSCSPAVGTGVGGLDRGASNPRGLLVYGEPPTLTPLTSATLKVTPGGAFNWGSIVPPYAWGYTNYKWKLDDGPWSQDLSITDSSTIALMNLSLGTHTVYVVGKNDAGYYQDDPFVYPASAGIPAHATASKTWTVTTELPGLRINEVLASNERAVLMNDGYPDLIELHNNSVNPVNLGGMGITDEQNNKYRYVFPAGTIIPSGGYLVLVADKPDGSPGIHTGFTLNKDGSSIYLYGSLSSGGALIDSVSFGLQVSDWSVGRVGAGNDWALTAPSFGSANVAAAVGDPGRLKINEWLAAETFAYSDDFVELFNPEPAPTPLGGLSFSDYPIGGWPEQHVIPALSFIPAKGYKVFVADGNAAAGADHLGFQLAHERGIISLIAPDSSIIDLVLYGPQLTDVSQGRSPSGSPEIISFPTPSPGSANPGTAGNCTVTTTTYNLIPLDGNWRYNASSDVSGTPWMATNYNDSGWNGPSPALFYYAEDNAGVSPRNTEIYNYRITDYFRTAFVITNDLSGFTISAAAKLDDGAVIYVNGSEVIRIRMASGTPTYYTYATQSGGDATGYDTFTLPNSYFHQGTNVIAVEVHNTSDGSGDMVWGVRLDAVRTVTNCIQMNVVINELMADNRTFTNADGTITDWVEFYNGSSEALDLSDMSITDSSATPRRWVFPLGVSVAPNDYLVVRMDPGMPPSTNNGAVLNTGFGLKAEGDKLFLFDSPDRSGSQLDAIAFGHQAGDFTLGRKPDGDGLWMVNLPTPEGPNIVASTGEAESLKINEWMASANNGSDWFEIYNPNPQPVDISGLYLTDDLNDRTKFALAPLSFIGVGEFGYVRFFADGLSDPGHVSFRLSAGGEALGIFPVTGAPIDTVVFGAQDTDLSEGRFPDGSTNRTRFPGTATPAAPNVLPLYDVVISEVLTHSELPFEDAIELHNVSMKSINVGGWYLSDNRNDPRRFRIPNPTLVPPGGFVVFYEYQFNPDYTGRPPAFALNSDGDDLYLFPADINGNLLGYRAGVKFGAADLGVSAGRFDTSIGTDFVALESRTFGADAPMNVTEFRSGTGTTNSYAKVGPIVISEIMYHPPDLDTNDNTIHEFIELHNISAEAVPLFHTNYPEITWRVRDAVDFDFPPGITLAPNGYLLLVSFDPTVITNDLDFRSRYGLPETALIFGPYQGRLANDNENIELYKPGSPEFAGTNIIHVPYVLVDGVKYMDRSPWASGADGTGSGVGLSLQRRFANLYGNEPVNWLAGVPTPGAPTGPASGQIPTITSITPSHIVAPGTTETLALTLVGDAPVAYQWYLNGLPVVGATSSSLVLANIQGNTAGEYVVVAANASGTAAGRVRINLAQPPVITLQPQSQVALEGGSAVFSVDILGSFPLSYQWQKNGSPIPGATNPVLVLTNIQAADEASYSVSITNQYGSTLSELAVLSLSALPSLVIQPQSTNAFLGSSTAFTVLASGTPPLRYHWRFNGTFIPNATNSSYLLQNVQMGNSGSYSVVVSNVFGAIVSSNAVLTVLIPPLMTITASDPIATEGGSDIGVITISRAGNITLPVSLNLQITGNAVADGDYVALSSPVIIPPGVTSTNVSVVTLDDSILEGDETVVITLRSGTGYLVGVPSSATVTIVDDDNLAPSVTLTSPMPDAAFNAPATVELAAVATDPDSSVARVVFYSQGTNILGESLTAPYAMTWSNVAGGIYTLTARAYDNYGASAISVPVSITVNAAPVVNITSPGNNASFHIPAKITINVTATDADDVITQVEFFSGTNLLGVDYAAPYIWAYTNSEIGEYTLSARALDSRGAIGVSSPVDIIVNPPAVGFTDNFDERGILSGYTNFVFGNNSEWTKEPGERNHAQAQGGHSGWLTWTAPSSGECIMQTMTTGVTGVSNVFDTVLAVYTGNSLSNLVLVASNDDMTNSPSLQSHLAFIATAGTAYQVAIDGFSVYSSGNFYFRMTAPNPNPVIAAHPQNQTVNLGANVIFSVLANGPGPFRYQWQFNGANLNNFTNSVCFLPNVQPVNAGSYQVIVYNSSGSVTSSPAILTVRVAPMITTQPQDQTANPGDDVTLIVAANGTLPFLYQWNFNGSAIPGATNNTYNCSFVHYTNAGFYTVRIIGSGGLALSRAAELTLRPRFVSPPTLTNGAYRLMYEGTIGKTYEVESGASLTNWSSLGAVSNTAVFMEYHDTNVVSTPRFYRLHQTPSSP